MAIDKAQRNNLRALGACLKRIRIKKGLTLKELGYIIDKDAQSISRVEMGDVNPTYLYLLKICEGLEIDIKELFTNDKT